MNRIFMPNRSRTTSATVVQRFRKCVPVCCVLVLAAAGPVAATGGGTDYLAASDRTALAGVSTDPWRVGSLPVPEFSAVVASRTYQGVYWAIRDASKDEDKLTAARDGRDCRYNEIHPDCTLLRNRARTQLWAFKLANGQLAPWNTSLAGVDAANPYFRRFTLPRTSPTAPDFALTPSYAALAEDPNQLMNNDWEGLAVNPRTGTLSIGAIGTYAGSPALCENRRVIDAVEPLPGGSSNQWRPTLIRDLPNYATTATGTNCNAEALFWLDDAATTTGHLYIVEKRVREFNTPRILEVGLDAASGRAVGAARRSPSWASAPQLLNLPPDVPTTVGGAQVRLDRSDQVTGIDVSQDGTRAIVTLSNCGFLVYDSPTAAGMIGTLRIDGDNPVPGFRLYSNATEASSVVQRNSCQNRNFSPAEWSRDDGVVAGFQPGPMGIEGVTFIGASKILLLLEDTTFLDINGKVLLGSRMIRIAQ